jgi:hypothetical protein
MIPAQDKTAFVDLVALQRMTAPLRGFLRITLMK